MKEKDPILERVNTNIIANLYWRGQSRDECAVRAGMCRQSFDNRIADPGRWRIKELKRLADWWMIPVETLFEDRR